MRVLMCALAIALLVGAAVAQPPSNAAIRLIVEGREAETGAGAGPAPTVLSGHLYLPVRPIYDGIGATLQWRDESKTLVITVPQHKVEFPTGERMMLVDGDQIDLAELPRVVDGVMYLEESVLAHTLPLDITYDREEKRVEVTYRWERRDVTFAELTGWPRFFRGREVIVTGEYRGWQSKGIEGPAAQGPPPRPRTGDPKKGGEGRLGDWIVADGDTGIYVCKSRLRGLHPLDDVGARVRIEAVGLYWMAGEGSKAVAVPYLRATRVERK